jgi:hypothetical protein
MFRYTPEQRSAYAEALYDLIRTWVEHGDSPFEIDLKRGVEWCTNARTGDRTPRANPGITLVLRINGGAEDSEGPAIVPTPTVFRPPDPNR